MKNGGRGQRFFFAASSRFFVPDKKKTEFFFASVAHFFAQRFKAEPAKRRQLFEASENDEPAIFFSLTEGNF